MNIDFDNLEQYFAPCYAMALQIPKDSLKRSINELRKIADRCEQDIQRVTLTIVAGQLSIIYADRCKEETP